MSLNGSLSKSTGLSGSLSGSYNYEQFTNKPKINGVELTGNKSFEDLGLPKQVQADYTQNDETQPDYIKNRPLVALSTLVTEETSDISANIDLKGVLTYRYQTIHIYNDTSYNMVQFLYGGKVIDHVSADGYSYIYVEKYTDIENLLFDIKFYGFDIKCEVADGELNVVTDIATNNNEVLLRDNKEEYIPTTDYSPATKRYVDDSVYELKSDLTAKIDKPATAPEVGKILKVNAVNEDGTFTCEWDDAPSGGGSGGGGIHLISRVVTESNAVSIEVTGLSTTAKSLSLRIYNAGSACGGGLTITVNGVKKSGYIGGLSGGNVEQASVRAWLYRDDGILHGRAVMANLGTNVYEWLDPGEITSIVIASPYNDGTTKYFQAGTIFEIYEGVYPNVN